MSIEKAGNIKLLVLDVDGVLTDGSVTYTSDNEEVKSFNIKDGLGIKLVQNAGISVGIITGRVSPMVKRRATELGIDPLIQGREDKGHALDEVSEQLGISLEQIAYMGDDLPDLSALSKAGLAMAPKDAHQEVLDIADWTSSKSGGAGAVRDACDFLLKARGAYEEQINRFRGTT